MTEKTSPKKFLRPLTNSFIVLFLSFQLFLGIHGFLTKNARFSWAMFARPHFYKIQINRIDFEGQPHQVDDLYLRPFLWGRSLHYLKQVRSFSLHWNGQEGIVRGLRTLGNRLCTHPSLESFPVRRYHIIHETQDFGPPKGDVVIRNLFFECEDAQ